MNLAGHIKNMKLILTLIGSGDLPYDAFSLETKDGVVSGTNLVTGEPVDEDSDVVGPAFDPTKFDDFKNPTEYDVNDGDEYLAVKLKYENNGSLCGMYIAPEGWVPNLDPARVAALADK